MIINRQASNAFKPRFPVSLNRQSLQSWGLTACYSMIEGGGSKLFDLSGNGLNATNVASPTWGVGPRGAALAYDGSTQDSTVLVNVAPASVPAALSSIASTGTSYSFSAWIKGNGVAAIGTTAPWSFGNTLFEGRTTGATGTFRAWSFGTESGKFGTARGTASSASGVQRIVSATSVSDNKWHFVVATVSANTASIYVDGELDATGTFTGNGVGDCSWGTGVNNVYAQIGARTTNAAATANFYRGTVDDMRIYSRLLQPTEVQQMYINPLGLFSVSPSPRYWYSTAATPPPPPAAATSGQYLMLLGVGT